jgi:hypothetical protein
MTTVWIDNGSEQGPAKDPGVAPEHIDYTAHDVGQFLAMTLEWLEDR